MSDIVLPEGYRDGLIRRVFGVEIKAGSLDLERRSIRVIASNETLDSYDHSVKLDWDLERYHKNPVVLWAHNQFGLFGYSPTAEELLPIGHSSDVGISSNRNLEATLNFVTRDAAPMAERVWQGFVQRSIRAVSVGFKPHRVVRTTDEDGNTISMSLEQNELFEISPVPMGANPSAVALSAYNEHENRILVAIAAKITKGNGDDMDADKMKERIATLEKQATDAQTALTAATTDVTELRAKNATLVADNTKLISNNATLMKDNGDLTETIIKYDVEALVGKKIVPAQREEYIELRKTNKKLFETMTSKMPDLGLADDVLGDTPDGTQNKTRKAGKSPLIKNALNAASTAAGGMKNG